MRHLFLFLFLLLFSFSSKAQFSVIPKPLSVQPGEGTFTLSSETPVIAGKFQNEAEYLQKHLQDEFQIAIHISGKKSRHPSILLQENPNLQPNEYYLSVKQDGIAVYGKTSKEIFFALQTLLQMLPAGASRQAEIPVAQIHDYPKFGYRGMHLDVSRHFFTADEVKRYLDYLAYFKFDKFHWHLTDDQGWRIEIKKYPKLTTAGAWRNGSQTGPYADMKFDTIRYGGFYTQEEILDVVRYAQKLHIDVIPEIEMPGHEMAAIAAYPEISCTKGTFEVRKEWGVEENILCPTEYTFKFLENVLDEVIRLFPYEYIHIGGDEAPKTSWKNSSFCQDLIQKLNLKDEHGLQSYFIKRMEKYLNSKGKKIIGWNEILEGGLAPNATVMSWTGEEGGIEAAKSGHKAIMTPVATNYFDHYQGDPKTEPLAFGGYTTLQKVYQYQPVPKELNASEAQYIWGTQGNVWTEYIPDFPQVEYMIFPRMMALSEVAWGTSDTRQYQYFLQRVQTHFKRFDRLGIRYSKAAFTQ